MNIIKAVAYREGIYVESDAHNPFDGEKGLCGYIDKITQRYYWIGFFESLEKAKSEYVKMIDGWIAQMQRNVKNAEDGMKKPHGLKDGGRHD